MNVLIIGASRGIGLELVRQYRADGASTVGTARDAAGLAGVTALGARAVLLDVRDEAAASHLAVELDGIAFDVVVVSAGVYGPRTDGLVPPERGDFDVVLHTNLLGPMRILPQVVASLADGAKLAVLSSRMGSIGLRSNASGWLYRASKAALNWVLKDTAIACEGKAVCVALHPGWVRTDMGGVEADLLIEQSVTDLRRTLAGLTAADNGRFLNHDGRPLDW